MSAPDSTKKKILVVDDDMAFASMLRATLAAKGYNVIACFDPMAGRIAIDQFKPDMITLDVDMAAGGGAWLLNLLKCDGRLLRLPILICTAVAKDSELHAKLGGPPPMGVSVMRKPFKLEAMLAEVSRLLSGIYPSSM